MSLFFDAAWFDARLQERGLSRADLARSAELAPLILDAIYANQRAPSAFELSCFAGLLGADLVQVTLRAGVATRAPARDGDASARIESIEARLDAMDAWLDEFERQSQKRA